MKQNDKKDKEYKEKLFSYGTLQLKQVQIHTFGRNLIGKPDTLSKYQLSNLKIIDPVMLVKSKQEIHHIAKYTGNEKDKINGTVFDVSSDELLKSDQYEVAEYQRVQICLDSGIKAWIYVGHQE